MANTLNVNYMQRASALVKDDVRGFYAHVLGWSLQEAGSNLDVFSCGEMTYGVQYCAASDALSDSDFRRSTWMSIKADDRHLLIQEIKALELFVLEELSDEENFFFQAPGGQVFVL